MTKFQEYMFCSTILSMKCSSSSYLPHSHKLAACPPTITFQAWRRKVKKKCRHPAESMYFRGLSWMPHPKMSAYVLCHYILLDIKEIGKYRFYIVFSWPYCHLRYYIGQLHKKMSGVDIRWNIIKDYTICPVIKPEV